ncbi:MAG: tRNA (N6-isopentenyl adenosine(37)-C2)-methylthiotransferase MiaB [Deltaproteobacteria bacterium]|nr:tRNA (N6-isopentenyl adenosine(37)-C2)-methylthiotransferase MiaB [Deltaproteobacteria bacterium]
MKKKLFIQTFGCQMNEYDSKKIAAILSGDYVPTDTIKDADLVFINTCSVREKARLKLYSVLGSLKKQKKVNPQLRIGVGGCVAQQDGEDIIRNAPHVDFVVGTHNLSFIPALLKNLDNGLGKQVAVDFRDEWEDLPLGYEIKDGVTAFVSISRGCDKNCSFCIVPKTRGPEVSRPLDEIIRECKLLLMKGVKEITLLGQTVNSWGKDLQPKKRFLHLLEEILKLGSDFRLRFTSPHPQEMRSDLLDFIGSAPQLGRHLHLPLQSGSDRVLKRMNRNYKVRRYLEIIEEAKSKINNLSITTDIIVGFPGESESDFNETLKIVELVEFDSSFSFIFSPRPGTKAAEFSDQIPREVAQDRLRRLQELQRRITEKRLKRFVGEKVEVLVEGPASKTGTSDMQGRNENNVYCVFPKSGNLKPGDFVTVFIQSQNTNTLRGEAVT